MLPISLGVLLLSAILSASADHHEDGPIDNNMPFERKKYEATFDPTGNPDGGPLVTLSFTYVAQTPVHAFWSWGMEEVGMDISAITGDRTWTRCVQKEDDDNDSDDDDGYICTSTYQTAHRSIVPMIVPRLIHESPDGGAMVHIGFPNDVKDFTGVTEPTHHVHIAQALIGPPDKPAGKVFFNPGEEFSFSWDWETEITNNFKVFDRKTAPNFEREVLMGCADSGGVVPYHRENTVGHVHTELSIRRSGMHRYHHTLNVTIHDPTEEDAGIYHIHEKPDGYQTWIEVVPSGADCAYPIEPVFHMHKTEGRHTILVFCQAESQNLSSVDLYHNGELLHSSPSQTVVKGQSVSNARIVAFKTLPSEDRPWDSFAGTYKCVATTADGVEHEHEVEYEFAPNPSPNYEVNDGC